MGLWRKGLLGNPEAPASGRSPGSRLPIQSSLSGSHPHEARAPDRGHALMARAPTKGDRVVWFLEGMLDITAGPLMMAHDCPRQERPTPRFVALSAAKVIVAQRADDHSRLRGCWRWKDYANPPTTSSTISLPFGARLILLDGASSLHHFKLAAHHVHAEWKG